jgi:L-serine deaminase
MTIDYLSIAELARAAEEQHTSISAAGLVEVPCIKRNAGGVSIAITAAEMALAGIKSVIPVDDVIDVNTVKKSP